MAVPEGTGTPESGNGDGSNEKVMMNVSLEFQLRNFCEKH